MALTRQEQDDLRTLLVQLFGQEASSWDMNEGTLSATAQMLDGARSCSKAMNYVPRPAGVIDKGYFKRQLKDLARRARNKDSMYETCLTTSKYQWKTAIIAASLKGL